MHEFFHHGNNALEENHLELLDEKLYIDEKHVYTPATASNQLTRNGMRCRAAVATHPGRFPVNSSFSVCICWLLELSTPLRWGCLFLITCHLYYLLVVLITCITCESYSSPVLLASRTHHL